MKVKWTTEWPKVAGRFWFYGVRYKNSSNGPSLYTVNVMISSNDHPVYVCEGQFLYKEEGAEGYFAPLEEPELPIS